MLDAMEGGFVVWEATCTHTGGIHVMLQRYVMMVSDVAMSVAICTHTKEVPAKPQPIHCGLPVYDSPWSPQLTEYTNHTLNNHNNHAGFVRRGSWCRILL